MDSDEEEVAHVPVFHPAALQYTIDRNTQQRTDLEKTRGRKCQLCMVGDESTKGTAKMLQSILDMERKYHRTMSSSFLYKEMAKRYNESVLWRTREILGDAETARRGFRKLTPEAVRLHYEQNHCKRLDRLLWQHVDYLEECLKELQNGGVWQTIDADPRRRINKDGVNIYVKLFETQQKCARLLTGGTTTTTKNEPTIVPRRIT